MGLALLLGAGFSKWAVDLPLANELFAEGFEPWGTREATRLSRVLDLYQDWHAANPAGFPEEFIAYALGLEASQTKAVLWYLARRLSQPFIWVDEYPFKRRRHVLMIDEQRGKEAAGAAVGFLRSVCTTPFITGIVTTNYDMLVEYALGTKGFNYGHRGEHLWGPGPYPLSSWGIPVTLHGWIRLAKIHGSISWDDTTRYSDGRRGLTGGALIVAPTPEKVPPPALVEVWDLARDILSKTTHLLVFGFGFNPYDEAVLTLFREGGRGIRSVLLVDISPPADRVRHLWPEAAVVVSPPPPDGSELIRKWARNATEGK